MAGKGNDEANFRINVEGNAADATKGIASSARLAAKSIAAFEDQIKLANGDLRRLRGNSDEVSAAKATLREKITKARESVSLLTVELNKQNTSYAAASKAVKSYGADVKDGLKNAVGKLGGARSDFSKALEMLIPASIRERVAGVVGPAMKSIGAKVSGAGAAFKASFGKALAPAGAALRKFFEGAKGVAGKAAFLGPLARGIGKSFGAIGAAIKPLVSASLPALGSGLKLVGVLGAGATAALLAVVAAAVAGAVAVIGFGLAASDAAAKMQRQREALWDTAENAKALGTQVQALAGKVPQSVEELNAMAVALSKTRINGKAVVSTMTAVGQVTGAVDATAGAKIQELITRNAAFGRMAIGRLELDGTGLNFEEVAKEYAAGTHKSIDAARKELRMGIAPIEAGSAALAKAAEKKFGKLNIENAFSLENAPKKLLQAFTALSSGVDFSPITDGLKEVFAQLSPDAPLGAAIKTLMTTLGGGFADVAGKSIPALLEGFKWLVVGALKIVDAFYVMKKQIKDAFAVGDWAEIWKALLTGMVKGLGEVATIVPKAIGGVAQSVMDAFTGKLKIHSPSKVFEGYGVNTTEGYAQGVEKGSARASRAASDMVTMPSGGASSGEGKGGFGGGVTVNITGVGGAAEMATPAFLSGLTQAIRNAATAQGALV